MRKSVLTLVMCFVSTSLLWSQTTVTIGTGTTNTLYGPVYIYSNTSPNTHSWYLSIYNAAEITGSGGSAGTITGVSWYKNDTGGYHGNDATFEIYMKPTTLNDFSGGAGNFDVESAGATLVYSSTTSGLPSSTGWVNYSFTAPFSWNGTDNIMVLSRWVRIGAGTGSVNWASTTLSGNYVSTSFNSSATMGSLYAFPNRPNIQFSLTSATSVEGISGRSKGIFVYPNPVADHLTLLVEEEGEATINIRSVTGAIVKQQVLFVGSQKKRINTESLPAGIYFLEAVLADKIYTTRFIK